jgi:hypothetical protein
MKNIKYPIIIIILLMISITINAQILKGIDLGDYRCNINNYLKDSGLSVERQNNNADYADFGDGLVMLLIYKDNILVFYNVQLLEEGADIIFDDIYNRYGEPELSNDNFIWVLSDNMICSLFFCEDHYDCFVMNIDYRNYICYELDKLKRG